MAPDNEPVLLNATSGTVQKTAGTATSSLSAGISFNNLGTTLVGAGVLSISSSVAQISGNVLAGGTWTANGTGTLVLPGGNFATNQATVTLSGTGQFPQIDSIGENDGSLSLVAGRAFVTAASFDNGGRLTIGPNSTFTVSAAGALLSTGSLTIDIGGTTASGQFGRFNVSGSVALGGTLNVALTGGYFPSAGQSYMIMSFGGNPTNSTFATVNGLTQNGNTIFTVNQGPMTFLLNSAVLPSPRVTSLQVDGTGWTPAFLSTLAAANQGNGTGYAIPVGSSAQLNPLAWTNLNQVQIRFDQNVNVSSASLALTGVNVASYSFNSFSYNATNFTATWTLSAPMGDDRLSLSLQAASSSINAITNQQGTMLDGEWVNGASTYPSGNGTAGGNFNFAFNVLPASANQDAIVNGQDIAVIAGRWLQTGTIAGDINGDNIVNAQDIAAIASRWLTVLPVAAGGGSSLASTDIEIALVGASRRAVGRPGASTAVRLASGNLAGQPTERMAAALGRLPGGIAAAGDEIPSRPVVTPRTLRSDADDPSAEHAAVYANEYRMTAEPIAWHRSTIEEDLLVVLAAARRS